MNILSYEQLHSEHFTTTLNGALTYKQKKGRGKGQEIQISNYRWQQGCFFLALSPQQLESVGSKEAVW